MTETFIVPCMSPLKTRPSTTAAYCSNQRRCSQRSSRAHVPPVPCTLYRASHPVSSGLTIHNVHCMYPCSSLLFRSHGALLDINVTGLFSGNAVDVVVQFEWLAQYCDITATGTSVTSLEGPAVYYCQNIPNETALKFASTTPPSSSQTVDWARIRFWPTWTDSG